MRRIALLGDGSDHGGELTSTNQDGSFVVNAGLVCAHGCEHTCPIEGHGKTAVTAVTTRSFINGKLIITQGATAGCGATITPPDRGVYVE